MPDWGLHGGPGAALRCRLPGAGGGSDHAACRPPQQTRSLVETINLEPQERHGQRQGEEREARGERSLRVLRQTASRYASGPRLLTRQPLARNTLWVPALPRAACRVPRGPLTAQPARIAHWGAAQPGARAPGSTLPPPPADRPPPLPRSAGLAVVASHPVGVGPQAYQSARAA